MYRLFEEIRRQADWRDRGSTNAFRCTFLDDALYTAWMNLFEMHRPEAEAELSEKNRKLFSRLCKKGSAAYILGYPDAYACFTYLMFYGT